MDEVAKLTTFDQIFFEDVSGLMPGTTDRDSHVRKSFSLRSHFYLSFKVQQYPQATLELFQSFFAQP